MANEFEQFVYTAGGTKVKGRMNNDFGVLSMTEGLDIYSQREIQSIMRVILDGDTREYGTSYRTDRVLKEGAVPKGLFNKKYRDEDYEYVKTVTRNEVKVLKQTHESNLLRVEGYSPPDYRQNPEKAPYRLAASTLLDGRVVVMRIGAINKIYGSDLRNGNFFTHAFVFPKGTDISKINIDELPFRFGLTPKEWGMDGEPIDLSKIGKVEKKQPVETKDMDVVDLLEVFKQSLSSKNKDVKSRMENKKIFHTQVKQGTKLFEVRNIVANMVVNDLKKGKERTVTCEDVLDELDFIETPYTNLLLSLESYIENENKLSEAYEKDDQTLIDRLEQKEKQIRESIQNNMKNENLDELMKAAQLQRQYLKLIAEKEALVKGKTLNSLNGSYMLKNDYKAAVKLELMVKTQMNKNTKKR